MTVYYPTFKPSINVLTMVDQVRTLPYAGEILVRVGNRLEPDQVVARTLVPGRGQRFPVARILGVSEQALADQLLLEDGADVEPNDVLVRVGRWRQRVWRCPIAGTLSTAEIEKGYLIVTPPAQSFELRAHLKGFVSAVEPYRSVTIQTPAALVRAAFGVGGEQHGVLRAAVTDAGDELLPEMLDERSALSILIGGAAVSTEALARAVELNVRGLIVGSITEEALRTFLGYHSDADWALGGRGWTFPPGVEGREFPLTLLVTEGLGNRPMCSRAFELLTSYDGWETSMDGRTWIHGPNMHRPYVIVPLPRANPDDIEEEEAAERLRVGSQIRILSHEALGQAGTLVAFLRGRPFPGSGAWRRFAAIRLEDGQVVDVPVENLEVLGEKK